jgi:hypothetical protein
MPTLLLTVEDNFKVAGRLILSPDIRKEWADRVAGRSVRLVRPDGSVLVSRVDCVGHLTPRRSGQGWPIALPGDVSKEDVPVGTEVWLLDEA